MLQGLLGCELWFSIVFGLIYLDLDDCCLSKSMEFISSNIQGNNFANYLVHNYLGDDVYIEHIANSYLLENKNWGK